MAEEQKVFKNRSSELKEFANVVEDAIDDLHHRYQSATATSEESGLAIQSSALRKGIQDRDSEEDRLVNLAGTGTSYYVLGKVERTPVLFPLDTGASINILSRRKFELLPNSLKQALTPVNFSGTLADGSSLQFDCRIVARGRLRLLSEVKRYVIPCYML